MADDPEVTPDDPLLYPALVGEAQTLPMTQAQKNAARKRRERLDELGGFGLRAP